MDLEPVTILLIEDSPGYVRLIRELLHEARGIAFNLEVAEQLSPGLARLARGGIDAILLDLSLPDSHGLQTLSQVRSQAPEIPIIVLTNMNDEEMAIKAVQLGAQDYLVKSSMEGSLLARAIRYAIERNRIEEALRNSHSELRQLAGHLQAVREEERAHIARELHDELGQLLTVAKIDAFQLSRTVAQESTPLAEQRAAIVEKLDSFGRKIDETIAAIRTLVTELRPTLLDDFGLEAAIEWQAQQFQERTGITCALTSETGEIEWDRDRSLAIFRILQEALTNVANHAHATRVDVSVKTEDGALLLQIHDDGLGITPADTRKANHFGILGMRERVLLLGGEIQIEGRPGKGTQIRVRVPLKAPAAPPA